MLEGAHDPGEQVYIHNFYRQWFYVIAIGGSAKYFLFRYGSLAIIIIFCHRHFIYSFQYIKVICVQIKYGCDHSGVATFATEILRMSEIALDPHLAVGSGELIIRLVEQKEL